MTVLEYLKNIGVDKQQMGIKIHDLPNYIEHPVWDSRTEQWLICGIRARYRESLRHRRKLP